VPRDQLELRRHHAVIDYLILTTERSMEYILWYFNWLHLSRLNTLVHDKTDSKTLKTEFRDISRTTSLVNWQQTLCSSFALCARTYRLSTVEHSLFGLLLPLRMCNQSEQTVGHHYQSVTTVIYNSAYIICCCIRIVFAYITGSPVLFYR